MPNTPPGSMQVPCSMIARAPCPGEVIVDVGAHEWSRFLPELRLQPRAWLVLVEPGRRVTWLEGSQKATQNPGQLVTGGEEFSIKKGI